MSQFLEGSIYWHRHHELSNGVLDVSQGGAQCSMSCPIIVLIGWMFSQERHLTSYISLYLSCGWDVLICHSPVINLWVPRKADYLAQEVLKILSKEISKKPRPVVFASFSGGTKTCLYKILQILLSEPREDSKITANEIQKIRTCIAGQIFDSCPIDFVSSIGIKFLTTSQPGKNKRSRIRQRIQIYAVTLAAAALDRLFDQEFEAQRSEQWAALKDSTCLGPMLFLYSKDDDLAPYKKIEEFIEGVEIAGAMVTSQCWENSRHVEHLRRHPKHYMELVTQFLSQTMVAWKRKHGFESEVFGGFNFSLVPDPIANKPLSKL